MTDDQRSAISDPPSAASDQRSAASDQRSAASGRRPAAGGQRLVVPELSARLAGLERGLVLAGAAGLLLTTGLFLVQQAAAAAGVPLAGAIGAPLLALLGWRC